MDLCVAGAICTREFLDLQEKVTAQRQVNVLTKAVDNVPAFTETRATLEQ